MEKLSNGNIAKTILVMGYGWEHPGKGEEERKLYQDKKLSPPSKMSRAVDSVAINLYRSRDHAEKILVTGAKMGHVASYAKVQESYFHAVAPEVPVATIGKAWTTSREIRSYFKYLRKQGETEGTIVFLAPHEERIRIIVDFLGKKRKNRGIRTMNFVPAEKYLSNGSLPHIPTKENGEGIQEDFADLPQTSDYRQFAKYEERARVLQKRAERWHSMPLIDYLFRFKKPSKSAGVR